MNGKTYDTLVEAIKDLKNLGYNQDFNLKTDRIECVNPQSEYLPDAFIIDSVYRFEGMTNPDDSSVLYALSTSDGKKGLMVDAYGAYAEALDQEMIKKLKFE